MRLFRRKGNDTPVSVGALPPSLPTTPMMTPSSQRYVPPRNINNNNNNRRTIFSRSKPESNKLVERNKNGSVHPSVKQSRAAANFGSSSCATSCPQQGQASPTMPKVWAEPAQVLPEMEEGSGHGTPSGVRPGEARGLS